MRLKRNTGFYLSMLAASASLMMASAVLTPAAAEPKGFDTYMADATQVVDHSAWEQFLSAYIVPVDGINLVRYGAVSEADAQKLADYINDLEAVNPTKLNRDEAFAYWANLYNAVTVKVILDNYPVKSIKDVSSGAFSRGPWKMELVTVNGQALSLDDIEHGIMRGHWDDPRVHYAVNCASYGCPNLNMTPLLGETLDDQLNAAAVAFVNHPRGVEVKKGKVRASSIYKWFKEDFGGNDKGVIEHLSQYAEGDLAEALTGQTKIHKFDYNWSLNEAAKTDMAAK